jgi:hypothetical protein
LGLEKVGKVRLSKSGRALEVELTDLPYTTFKLHLYAPKTRVQKILDMKILETDISLLVGDKRALSCEKKELKG